MAGETRKTVTVMFTDAVESTALGERIDPEALRRSMTRYFDAIRDVIERHGGVVEKYIGDAVMAVFGVPVAHEDDALRAVRAAHEVRGRLAVVDAEVRGAHGSAIAWRTGINTGEVVAGDATTGQRFVAGDAVNVGARLEQSAMPGEIVLGESTYQLVRDWVTVEEAQPIVAKGKSEALRAYRLTSLRPGEPARAGQLRAPMIGRDRPSRLLRDSYEAVVEESACHLFTVLGEAGVGKSRLVDEFLAGISRQTLVLQGRCLSYGEGITYYPIAEIVRAACTARDTDSAAQLRRRLRDVLGDQPNRRHVVERLAELTGVAATRAGRDETFWAVRRLVETLAVRQPLVLVIDDLHWAESTLLDLVDELSDWSPICPC